MKIEDIKADTLKQVDDTELYVMRLRFIQLYEKNFHGNDRMQAGGLNRSGLLDKYRLLVHEMRRRGLRYNEDQHIDRAVFRKAMFGIDVRDLGDLVVVPDYMNIGGSFVKNPVQAEDVDIIIRDHADNRDEGLELKVARAVKAKTGKDVHFVYAPRGPHSTYVPMYDLILRGKPRMQRVPVEEAKVAKAERLRLKLVGTGAMDSPRIGEALLVQYKEISVLIDADDRIKVPTLPRLDAVLVCDEQEKYMKAALRIATAFGLPPPSAREYHNGGLTLEPFAVRHTKHKTYAYKIKAGGASAVYAPEFYEFPSAESKDADLAIVEGSAWDKPIVFTGNVGGHAAVLDTMQQAKEAGVGRVVVTHVGKPVEAHLGEAKEMGIEIGRDGQVLQPIAKTALMKLTPGRAFTPLKTKGGYGTYEFGSVDALWTTWAQGYIPEPGVAVETKFDGFRVQVHKVDSTVRILSEDAKRDLASRIPDVSKEVASMGGTLILDGELTINVGGKKVERKDMPSYLMAEKPPTFKARIHVFDVLWHGTEDLHNKPWSERQQHLSKVFGGVDELLLTRVKPSVAKSKEAFLAAVHKHSGEEHSEGAMCKVVNSTYPTGGSTNEWAKFKNIKELRVKVVERESKEGGGYIYTCELKGGVPIGRTYATKIEASVGDVLEVGVAEVKYDEAKEAFTWDNPIVRSKKAAGTALTTPSQAKAIASRRRTKAAADEVGNITFDQGDRGTGIVQIHIMGLSEEDVDKFRAEQNRALVARMNVVKLEGALKGIIGEHGAHLDMRLRRGKENTWQGNEIFIGNISGLSKVKQLIDGSRKLRAPWKQGRAEEPSTNIKGPLGWMEAGARRVEFFEPGTPGASANEWGAMLRIDKFNWEMYMSDEHAKKFRITDAKIFNGNWLFSFVPVTPEGKKGERLWMISHLADDDHTKPVKKALQLEFRIYKQVRTKQIVGGVVYEPNVVDTQGDYATEEEIQDAMYHFMEKYARSASRIKVQHEGQRYTFPILECFQPEQDMTRGGKTVKKGSWWLMLKVTDPTVWTMIEQGKLTAFSMGGVAAEG